MMVILSSSDSQDRESMTGSSQLVDNMNANIHLRALLTDLFLIDEIIKRSLARD